MGLAVSGTRTRGQRRAVSDEGGGSRAGQGPSLLVAPRSVGGPEAALTSGVRGGYDPGEPTGAASSSATYDRTLVYRPSTGEYLSAATTR